MSIAAPAAIGPMIRPKPFVVVARPEIVPRFAGGVSLNSSPHASVITAPPATATGKMSARYQSCHCCASPATSIPPP